MSTGSETMAEVRTVKELREERGLTQLELAYKVGISLSTISGIETGHQEPRVGMAQKIAAALGVPVEAIDWERRETRPRRKPGEGKSNE